MSKRKLNKQQQKRIQANQQAQFEDIHLMTNLARVISHQGSHVIAKANDDLLASELLKLKIKSNLATPVVGDLIAYDKDKMRVDAISIRQNELIRPRYKDKSLQNSTMAANIDLMIFIATCSPKTSTKLIDRFIQIGLKSNIPMLLCLNKNDLGEFNEWQTQLPDYQALFNDILTIQTNIKTDAGLDTLKQQIKGKTSILVGQSGVGKSSIMNRLCPDLDLQTQQISSHISQGRHTTTRSTLFSLDQDTHIIDSPGFRELATWGMNLDDVLQAYPEITEVAYDCPFKDCSHIKEEDCAVKSAVQANKIHIKRYENYKSLYEQIKF